ncbi:class I SAM-dependent methyltransferase [Patescibacteria group bacterium]|nr:class I SAM-dependent methyltransferase [Patescibacteria group bacterium]
MIKDKIPGGKKLIDAKTLLEKTGIGKKMSVADLGCGRRGHFSLQSAKLVGPQGVVYAIDIVKDALASVEGASKVFGVMNLKTIWADLEIYGSTKLKDDSIDLVILNNVLFQTTKEKEIIKEGIRILKKTGKFLIVDWKKSSTLFGPPMENRVSIDEIKQTTREVGLKLVKEFTAGPSHYALIFKK